MQPEQEIPVPKKYEAFVAICKAKTREEKRAAWIKAFNGHLTEEELEILLDEDTEFDSKP